MTNQIQNVSNFQELATTTFKGDVNAMRWKRELVGDFSEIVDQIELSENLVEVSREVLCDRQLSERGQLARDREIILNDLKALKSHGAAPTLNLNKKYEKDDSFFPTDVYSFHVYRSPIPTDTFLCMYHGASSEILPNPHGVQKILVPEILDELKRFFDGPDDSFEAFLEEYFFDLHYQAKPEAEIISLGNCHLWKLAVDHPESEVNPCLHRAPEESDGELRLMVFC